ncbi:hypothetical protein [Hymenobacter sp. YC55]|uniref:hypothetical protein n=1 Tax=Hymenobacter sp. YC55 TaxID=3034019 RepID=UPI0023F6E498|nr:hypothetical protein [Hymenobacter sp. YC55]MDF7809919.1 hypothetical protein [Hymenobacter sp. YC55]
MSLTISDVSYAGEAASNFIVKSVVGNEIVSGGHAYVKDGIKKEFTIPRFQVGDVIQDRQATPTSPKGAATVDGRKLVPADYMLYDEFNPRDFEDHWFAAQLNPTLIDRRLPVTVESVIIQEYLKQHNKWLGGAILRGDTSRTDSLKYFNGIVTRAIADAEVPKVASPVVLTVNNIAQAFRSTLNRVSADVLYEPGLKFFVSYKTAQLWEEAQQNPAALKGVDMTLAGINRFSGRTIVPLFGMPDNTILLGKGSADMGSNIWVGMNSVDDATVQFMKLQANSELYFIKMLMKVDTNYGYGQELALYTL